MYERRAWESSSEAAMVIRIATLVMQELSESENLYS